MKGEQSSRDMLGRKALASVDDALETLFNCLEIGPPVEERVPLEEGFGRILAVDIVAAENLPSHPRSIVDGYAVRAADTYGASESMPSYLTIVGEVVMGKQPAQRVERGSCLAIPTGGLLPEGADSVVMFEHTIAVDESLIEIVKPVGTGGNLIQAGEDIAAGEVALPAGHRLRPQDIGVLAGLGIAEILVHRRLRVGLFATGDEIIDYRRRPEPGQIRNINNLSIAAQARRAGALTTDYGIAGDHRELFMEIIGEAVADNDLVIFSGGSSVGVRDLGEEIIEAMGPPGVLVHGVRLKPGKPVLIGMAGTTPIFGLPGHPVSAMICFDTFVAPTIARLTGESGGELHARPQLMARLSRNINSAPGRRDIVRVRLFREQNGWLAEPVLGKSGSISTLSRAHGYFVIDEESQGTMAGSTVTVYLYS